MAAERVEAGAWQGRPFFGRLPTKFEQPESDYKAQTWSAFEVWVALSWQAPKPLFPEQKLFPIQERKVQRVSGWTLSEFSPNWLVGLCQWENRPERSQVLSPAEARWRKGHPQFPDFRDKMSFLLLLAPCSQTADHEHCLEWWMEVWIR